MVARASRTPPKLKYSPLKAAAGPAMSNAASNAGWCKQMHSLKAKLAIVNSTSAPWIGRLSCHRSA
jgi:hypothetical protein